MHQVIQNLLQEVLEKERRKNEYDGGKQLKKKSLSPIRAKTTNANLPVTDRKNYKDDKISVHKTNNNIEQLVQDNLNDLDHKKLSKKLLVRLEKNIYKAFDELGENLVRLNKKASLDTGLTAAQKEASLKKKNNHRPSLSPNKKEASRSKSHKSKTLGINPYGATYGNIRFEQVAQKKPEHHLSRSISQDNIRRPSSQLYKTLAESQSLLKTKFKNFGQTQGLKETEKPLPSEIIEQPTKVSVVRPSMQDPHRPTDIFRDSQPYKKTLIQEISDHDDNSRDNSFDKNSPFHQRQGDNLLSDIGNDFKSPYDLLTDSKEDYTNRNGNPTHKNVFEEEVQVVKKSSTVHPNQRQTRISESSHARLRKSTHKNASHEFSDKDSADNIDVKPSSSKSNEKIKHYIDLFNPSHKTSEEAKPNLFQNSIPNDAEIKYNDQFGKDKNPVSHSKAKDYFDDNHYGVNNYLNKTGYENAHSEKFVPDDEKHFLNGSKKFDGNFKNSQGTALNENKKSQNNHPNSFEPNFESHKNTADLKNSIADKNTHKIYNQVDEKHQKSSYHEIPLRRDSDKFLSNNSNGKTYDIFKQVIQADNKHVPHINPKTSDHHEQNYQPIRTSNDIDMSLSKKLNHSTSLEEKLHNSLHHQNSHKRNSQIHDQPDSHFNYSQRANESRKEVNLPNKSDTLNDSKNVFKNSMNNFNNLDDKRSIENSQKYEIHVHSPMNNSDSSTRNPNHIGSNIHDNKPTHKDSNSKIINSFANDTFKKDDALHNSKEKVDSRRFSKHTDSISQNMNKDQNIRHSLTNNSDFPLTNSFAKQSPHSPHTPQILNTKQSNFEGTQNHSLTKSNNHEERHPSLKVDSENQIQKSGTQSSKVYNDKIKNHHLQTSNYSDEHQPQHPYLQNSLTKNNVNDNLMDLYHKNQDENSKRSLEIPSINKSSQSHISKQSFVQNNYHSDPFNLPTSENDKLKISFRDFKNEESFHNFLNNQLERVDNFNEKLNKFDKNKVNLYLDENFNKSQGSHLYKIKPDSHDSNHQNIQKQSDTFVEPNMHANEINQSSRTPHEKLEKHHAYNELQNHRNSIKDQESQKNFFQNNPDLHNDKNHSSNFDKKSYANLDTQNKNDHDIDLLQLNLDHNFDNNLKQNGNNISDHNKAFDSLKHIADSKKVILNTKPEENSKPKTPSIFKKPSKASGILRQNLKSNSDVSGDDLLENEKRNLDSRNKFSTNLNANDIKTFKNWVDDKRNSNIENSNSEDPNRKKAPSLIKEPISNNKGVPLNESFKKPIDPGHKVDHDHVNNIDKHESKIQQDNMHVSNPKLKNNSNLFNNSLQTNLNNNDNQNSSLQNKHNFDKKNAQNIDDLIREQEGFVNKKDLLESRPHFQNQHSSKHKESLDHRDSGAKINPDLRESIKDSVLLKEPVKIKQSNIANDQKHKHNDPQNKNTGSSIHDRVSEKWANNDSLINENEFADMRLQTQANSLLLQSHNKIPKKQDQLEYQQNNTIGKAFSFDKSEAQQNGDPSIIQNSIINKSITPNSKLPLKTSKMLADSEFVGFQQQTMPNSLLEINKNNIEDLFNKLNKHNEEKVDDSIKLSSQRKDLKNELPVHQPQNNSLVYNSKANLVSSGMLKDSIMPQTTMKTTKNSLLFESIKPIEEVDKEKLNKKSSVVESKHNFDSKLHKKLDDNPHITSAQQNQSLLSSKQKQPNLQESKKFNGKESLKIDTVPTKEDSNKQLKKELQSSIVKPSDLNESKILHQEQPYKPALFNSGMGSDTKLINKSINTTKNSLLFDSIKPVNTSLQIENKLPIKNSITNDTEALINSKEFKKSKANQFLDQKNLPSHEKTNTPHEQDAFKKQAESKVSKNQTSGLDNSKSKNEDLKNYELPPKLQNSGMTNDYNFFNGIIKATQNSIAFDAPPVTEEEFLNKKHNSKVDVQKSQSFNKQPFNPFLNSEVRDNAEDRNKFLDSKPQEPTKLSSENSLPTPNTETIASPENSISYDNTRRSSRTNRYRRKW